MSEGTRRAPTPRAPRVNVEITGEVIERSIERSSSHCMIAEAVKASVSDAMRVSVDLQTIRFSNPKTGLRYTYLTPRVGQVALIQFDQGIKPEPFSFQLRNGQVSRMAQRTPTKGHARNVTGKKELRDDVDEQGNPAPTSVKRVVGGTPPPRAALGSRRAFGLRNLEI